MPFSVMNPVTSSAGVTSNDGFSAREPSGAILVPATTQTSSWDLCSMTMSPPHAVDGS